MSTISTLLSTSQANTGLATNSSAVSNAAKPPKDLTIPEYHHRIMCFDTETTGLLPKHKRGDPFPPITAYPHITQMSWIVYNLVTNQIEEAVNKYVNIPETAEISPESTAVSGITREIMNEQGVDIVPLLIQFYASYMKCDCIVAHNLHFDTEIVRQEMWRNKVALLDALKNPDRVNQMTSIFTKKFNEAYHIDTFCTMMNTIDLCGIAYPSPPVSSLPVVSPESPTVAQKKPYSRFKFPKLIELYCILFDPDTQPKDLHNSIVDVLVCLRCFLKVRGATEITESDFQSLVSKYSRTDKV